MFKVECFFLSFILNATLHVNVMSRAFIFVKSNDISSL
jgi:hypothetical protein